MKGLYGKYIVRKSDTGKVVENCFVLCPEKDRAAVTALRAYAKATDNELLAAEIIGWVGAEKPEPLALEELREMDGEPVWIEDLLIPKCSCYNFVQKIGGHCLLVEPRDYPAEDVMIPHYSADNESHGYGETWLAYRRKPEVSRNA